MLVSVRLSKSSRLHKFSSSGKDFHLSVQLGILDGLAGSVHGQVELAFGVLVGQGYCPCSEVRESTTGWALWLGKPAGYVPHSSEATLWFHSQVGPQARLSVSTGWMGS